MNKKIVLFVLFLISALAVILFVEKNVTEKIFAYIAVGSMMVLFFTLFLIMGSEIAFQAFARRKSEEELQKRTSNEVKLMKQQVSHRPEDTDLFAPGRIRSILERTHELDPGEAYAMMGDIALHTLHLLQRIQNDRTNNHHATQFALLLQKAGITSPDENPSSGLMLKLQDEIKKVCHGGIVTAAEWEYNVRHQHSDKDASDFFEEIDAVELYRRMKLKKELLHIWKRKTTA